MADGYAVVLGIVQVFGDGDPIKEREVSGQTVREFTVKTFTTQKLVRVTLWPEFEEVFIEAGALVALDGKFTTNERNGTTYYNVSPKSVVVVNPIGKFTEQVSRKPSKTETLTAVGPTLF